MAPKAFRLPTPAEGVEGLNNLMEIVGIENLHQFLRWARDTTDTQITDFVELIAGQQIDDTMKANPGTTYVTARLLVAKRWGYFDTGLSNFYRFANRGYTRVTGKDPRWL